MTEETEDGTRIIYLPPEDFEPDPAFEQHRKQMREISSVPRWSYYLLAGLLVVLLLVASLFAWLDFGPPFVTTANQFHQFREKELLPIYREYYKHNRDVNISQPETEGVALASEYFQKKTALFKLEPRIVACLKTIDSKLEEISQSLSDPELTIIELRLEEKIKSQSELINHMKSRAIKEDRMSDMPPASYYDPKSIRKELLSKKETMESTRKMLWGMLGDRTRQGL